MMATDTKSMPPRAKSKGSRSALLFYRAAEQAEILGYLLPYRIGIQGEGDEARPIIEDEDGVVRNASSMEMIMAVLGALIRLGWYLSGSDSRSDPRSRNDPNVEPDECWSMLSPGHDGNDDRITGWSLAHLLLKVTVYLAKKAGNHGVTWDVYKNEQD